MKTIKMLLLFVLGMTLFLWSSGFILMAVAKILAGIAGGIMVIISGSYFGKKYLD